MIGRYYFHFEPLYAVFPAYAVLFPPLGRGLLCDKGEISCKISGYFVAIKGRGTLLRKPQQFR